MKLRESSRLATAALLLLLVIAASAHGAIFTVTNVNDSGPGSLRQAIFDSNATPPGPNTIRFNITVGSPPFLIFPTTQLPTITVPVTVNGLSQAGAAPNTLPNADNAIQKIVLNGFFQPVGNGLTVAADGCVIKGMVINNFAASNLELDSNGNTVQGCFFGVDATGTIAGTGLDVNILVQGGNNLIGGANPADRNIISADFIGIYMFGAATTGNSVKGNFIGLAANGTTPLPNFEGIFIFDAPGNLVGGATPAAGNVISGNTFANIYINNTPASGNTVKNNLIGTNATGTAAAGSTTIGVVINSAPNNTIGGAAGTGNVISGGTFGMQIVGVTATGNQVAFNKIGTDKTGTLPIPNALGIELFGLANGNEIGEGNIIAFNTGDGVQVDGTGTNHNTITKNSIFSNGTLGIELSNGGNDMLPAPVLTSATNGGSTTVTGTLNVPTEPITTFRIEFFSDDVCEPGGKVFIGARNVTTDGSGFASFTFTFPLVPGGSTITATATDPAGNTSEFSNCATIPGTPNLVVSKTALVSPVQAGTNAIFLVKVTNNGTGLANNVVVSDTLPVGLTFVSCSSSQGTCGAVLNVVTANVGTILAGQSATVAIIATVGTSVANGTKITNTASVAATGIGPVTATGSINVSNVCPLGMQIFTDLVSGNPIPAAGTTQTYTYRVALKACNAVFGVIATGSVPGFVGCTPPTASVGTVTCVPGTIPGLMWTIPSLAAGQTATLLVTVTVDIPANAPCGSPFQIASPWSATYYFAGLKKTAGPTPPLNVVVTCP